MIEKLKSISKTKWILMGALAVVIIIVLILLLARPKEKTVSLFEDQYPMKVTQTSKGGLVIELDGSKTKDVDWEIEEGESFEEGQKVRLIMDMNETVDIVEDDVILKIRLDN